MYVVYISYYNCIIFDISVMYIYISHIYIYIYISFKYIYIYHINIYIYNCVDRFSFIFSLRCHVHLDDVPGPFGQRLRHRFAEHHGGPVPERGGTGTDAGRPDVAVAWFHKPGDSKSPK